MFKKPFKVKSNTKVKNSERKNLLQLLQKKFSILSQAQVDTILPKKDDVYVSKIVTANEKDVLVYQVQSRAVFFIVDDYLFPSVYLLWEFPQIAVPFTTNSYVYDKLKNGADLMLPGVITNPGNTHNFLKNGLAMVNTCDNKASVAVGLITMSSNEMSKLLVGKCVNIYHFYPDNLCTDANGKIIPLPKLGPSEDFTELNSDNIDSVEVSRIPEQETRPREDNDENELCEGAECLNLQEHDESEAASEQQEIDSSTEMAEESMDDVLFRTFLTVIKYSKTLEIPILTSSFFKLEILSYTPEIEIKKTSYKKVGQFLKTMEKEGFIVIKERKKGVEMIESINKEHPKFIEFYAESNMRPKKVQEEASNNPSIVESYIVTQAVLPIFQLSGVRKGETVLPIEVRRCITNYVKTHNLQDETNKRFVNVNDQVLKGICKNELSVTWEDLIEKVTSVMKTCYKVTVGEEQTSGKGKIPPIIMSIQTRSGNKKVTIIDNLELYNIKLVEFGKECQHGVAASTSISRPPSKKTDQILIQGNQILFAYNLLTEKYKIPKKYIKGLEHAPKKK